MATDQLTTLKITDAAVWAIRIQEALHLQRTGRPWDVGFVWVDGALNNNALESQLALAFFEISPGDEDTYVINGVRLVISVPTRYRPLFEGKTIDFEGGRFVLNGGQSR